MDRTDAPAGSVAKTFFLEFFFFFKEKSSIILSSSLIWYEYDLRKKKWNLILADSAKIFSTQLPLPSRVWADGDIQP